MTSFCSTNDDVLTVSYEVSELIDKMLKPYDYGGKHIFGSTYLCEQFFSKMNIIKSRYKSRLTDENLNMHSRVATSSVRPDI